MITMFFFIANQIIVVLDDLITVSVSIPSDIEIGSYDVHVDDLVLENGFVVDVIDAIADNYLADAVSIYPNPSRDVFNVNFISNEQQTIKVRVLNLVGEIIFTEDLENFEGEYTHSFNLSEYSKGVYLLELDTDNGIVNKKLILQ